MTRADILAHLDGTHQDRAPVVAVILNGVIAASAVAIAVETLPGLSPKVANALHGFEIAILAVFLAEYITRVICAPKPWRYILSFWGLVDLLACLPALALINAKWQVVRTFRLLRVVRIFKLFRGNHALDRLAHAVMETRGELTVFVILAGIMLYVASVGIYLFENAAQPEVFSSIPHSFWWAVASFTTVGYGDMVPITTGGRVFTTFILFLGLGVVAVPAAIVTTALLEVETTLEPKRRKKARQRAEESNSSNKGETE